MHAYLGHALSFFSDFFINELDTLLDSHPSPYIAISGDFNRFDVRLLASAHKLEQKVFDATREEAILDHFYASSSPDSDYPAEVGPPSFTKRRGFPRQFFLNSSSSPSDKNEDTFHVVDDCRTHRFQSFFTQLRSLNFSDLHREDDVDRKVALFYEKFRHWISVIPKESVKKEFKTQTIDVFFPEITDQEKVE